MYYAKSRVAFVGAILALNPGQVAEWFKALDSKLQTEYFRGFPPVTIALQVCHNERVTTSNAFLGFP